MSEEITRLMTEAEAHASVDRTKRSLQDAADELVRQINGRAWIALGYQSWDDMREAVYGGAAIIVPRADRPELTAQLAAGGLSQTQISETLGVSQATISGDLQRVINSDNASVPATRIDSMGREQVRTKPRTTPPAESDPPSDEDLLDGREWTGAANPSLEPARPEPPKPKRRPLPEAFTDATHDFVRIAERFDRLRQDDRFTRNRHQTHHRASDIVRALDSIAQFAADMDLPAAETSEEARRWWATSLHNISDALTGVANSLEQEK
ncbi:hypothetical protein [Streptomyces stelliscabiei]|uniref:Uncharacterized protein n=1 Tax=Streptomyces stelliscabiei TaxID=146820 RepID=A0A8I0P095_9ACTN|nr:hypothetical protein [Streptomyces stelliscabiei]KND45332.1 hypothetical protein IQ64_07595 [Streptomyces stelliscabiei]MBE1597161.1 hypothetical protein [Streptomyces stelliscabiei]